MRHTSLYTFSLGLLSLFCLLFWTACQSEGDYSESQAADVEEVEPAPMATMDTDMEEGKAMYVRHCETCHGEDGTGEGESAELLEGTPPDLTVLSQKHGGEFPLEWIYNVIDGREQFAKHGTREMPFWGEVWSQQGGEEVVNPNIEKMVMYLKSIQQ